MNHIIGTYMFSFLEKSVSSLIYKQTNGLYSSKQFFVFLVKFLLYSQIIMIKYIYTLICIALSMSMIQFSFAQSPAPTIGVCDTTADGQTYT